MDIKVYLGRFSPLHLGHQQVIDKLISVSENSNIIIMIGSSNVINDKTPFTFNFRCQTINSIYPDIKIVPIPDFNDDQVWLNYIKNIEKRLKSKFTFFGGSEEDLQLLDTVFDTQILIDRFNEGQQISGTKVREALKNKDLEYLNKSIDPRTYNLLTNLIY